MKKKVVLVGGYQKTYALAKSLRTKGYEITIINLNYQHCIEFAQIEDIHILHGDGTRPYILDDAGIYDFDLAIALTRRDDDNLVICELCKKKFNVKRTVALVNDPEKVDFFYKMGIDSVVCSITTVTNLIEQQALMDQMSSIFELNGGKVKITQLAIPKTAPVVNKKLWELNLPQEVVIGCILRGDTNIVPRGDVRIHEGDILVMIASDQQQALAVKELTGK
ncbi:potassium channel family protein [Anaerorhabdus furcosa]|uniref:Trk system potassium uptake protein TrkA n=1 Tax=Anaerorhabdus furcosa TaxID=118967 RepID=A0A1T4QAY6_9FIRM|nr:NAD-binding protein [Anaerorhabdus furcosa]SKA00398.1 trk system potassium uptake protein TrkA [Anaerorhabdus furcosa]